jgi:hypothetical protein
VDTGLHQKRCNKSNENKESQKQLIEIQKLTSISLKKNPQATLKYTLISQSQTQKTRASVQKL